MAKLPDQILTLGDLFAYSCQNWPERTAANYRPRFRTLSWSYRELWDHSISMAELMEAQGVKAGDRVIIAGHNSPYWLAAFWGTQVIGAVAVPLSPESGPEFVEKIIEQTEAKVFMRSLLAETKDCSVPTFDLEAIEKPTITKDRTPVARAGDDLSEIVYTSGTTGFPKGVMLTHRNLLSNLRDLHRVIEVTPEHRLVSILPLFHMFEQMGGMIAPISAGAQISYASSRNPNHLKWIFQADQPNTMLAVPEFLRLIYLKLTERAAAEGKLKTLRLIMKLGRYLPMAGRRQLLGSVHRKFGWRLHTIASGGAPLERTVGRFWEGLGIYILQGYGLTETSPILTVNRYRHRKVESVGQPLESVAVRIAEEGQSVPTFDGTISGEVQARGPNVFAGYWQNEAETKAAFTSDGWYRTGDVGYFDDDGFLHLKGRLKHMIVLANGEKVHPEDLEEKLNREAGVVDSTVLGLERGGSVEVHAVLLLDAETDRKPEEIIESVNQEVMEHQRIKGVSVWSRGDFPRTSTKKVKKHEVEAEIKTQLDTDSQTPWAQAAATDLERVLARVLEVSPERITAETRPVEDLGLDSLGRISLVSEIETRLDVSLDEGEIAPGTTVQELEQIIVDREHKQVRYEFKPKLFSGTLAGLRALLQPLLLKPMIWLWAPMERRGLEHLEQLQRPVLFYANHISPADAPAVYAALPNRLRRRTGVAAASDVVYEKSTLFWKLFRYLGERLFAMIPFARYGQVKTSLEHVGRSLDAGHSVLFFPEGSMSKNGSFQGFKDGAGLLAQEMNVEVVPVKLAGTDKVVPPPRVAGESLLKWPRRSQVRVTFGAPITVDQTQDRVAVKKSLEEALLKLS